MAIRPATRANWDTLPVEISSKIIRSLNPEDFRRTWLTRHVSRSFKNAVEHAFKSQVVPRFSLSIIIQRVESFYALGKRIDPIYEDVEVEDTDIEDTSVEEETEGPASFISSIKFTMFSPDDSKAVFHDSYCFSGDGPFPLTGVAERHVRLKIESFPQFPLAPFKRMVWEDTMNTYLARDETDADRYTPYLSHSDFLYKLTYVNRDQVDVNWEDKGFAIDWRALVNIFVKSESKIGEELKQMASEDLEKTRWRLPYNASMEKGLRIALSSKFARFERFKTCLFNLADDAGRICFHLHPKDTEDDPEVAHRYLEWLGYITA